MYKVVVSANYYLPLLSSHSVSNKRFLRVCRSVHNNMTMPKCLNFQTILRNMFNLSILGLPYPLL